MPSTRDIRRRIKSVKNTAQITKAIDRKSTRLNSSHSQTSYAVFCLKKKIIDFFQRFWEPARCTRQYPLRYTRTPMSFRLYIASLGYLMHATSHTDIYTLSLHDALPIYARDIAALQNFTTILNHAQHTRHTPAHQVGQKHGANHEGHRSEEHTSELQSQSNLVCRLLLEKKNYRLLSTILGARAVHEAVSPALYPHAHVLPVVHCFARLSYARYVPHRHLHSFPTRRSSDLCARHRRLTEFHDDSKPCPAHATYAGASSRSKTRRKSRRP